MSLLPSKEGITNNVEDRKAIPKSADGALVADLLNRPPELPGAGNERFSVTYIQASFPLITYAEDSARYGGAVFFGRLQSENSCKQDRHG